MNHSLSRLKSKVHQEVDEHGTWAISYGDMITLLLTFFIIFFSTDKSDNRLKHLQAEFIDHLQAKTILQKNENTSQEMSVTKLPPDTKVEKVGKLLIVEFPNISFFDLGKIELNHKGTKALQEFTQSYLPFAGSFHLGIRAFTDHKKVTPGKRYLDNLELSALRGISAMRVLQKAGLPLKTMKIAGYGEYPDADRTIATNDQALSRRVVLIIEPQVGELK